MNKKIFIIKTLILSCFIILGAQITLADTYNNDLRLGSTGQDVINLQTLLEGKGYLIMPTGVAKGYYGQKTLNALAQYQKFLGLPAFGFFGPMTRKYLNDDNGNSGGGNLSLRITSPNGGEIWQKGTTQNITWKSPQYFRATYADIKLTREYVCTTQICPAIAYMPYTIASNISINNNSYSWNVGKFISDAPSLPYCASIDASGNCLSPVSLVPDGDYRIQICETGTSNCDSSDKTFTITSTTTIQAQIKVISPNGGEKWQIGSTHQIMWTSTDNTANSKVDIYLSKNYNCTAPAPCAAPLLITLDKNISTNAIYNWLTGTDIVNNPILAGDYSLQVCVAGTNNCDSSDKTFSLISTPILLKVCPSEKIVNKMPTIYPNYNSTTTYYILNGQRREASEFDTNWLALNCTINEQIVY